MSANPTVRVATAALAIALGGCMVKPEVVSVEPPAGGLRSGQTVLVDDGKCPAGQITRVTGGDSMGVVTGITTRRRECVAR